MDMQIFLLVSLFIVYVISLFSCLLLCYICLEFCARINTSIEGNVQEVDVPQIQQPSNSTYSHDNSVKENEKDLSEHVYEDIEDMYIDDSSENMLDTVRKLGSKYLERFYYELENENEMDKESVCQSNCLCEGACGCNTTKEDHIYH